VSRVKGGVSWRNTPPGTVTFGASAMEVETGLWRSMRPVLDLEKCVSCLKCWVQCPDASIMTDEDARVCGINEYFCKGCGVCQAVCPAGAISMRPESDFSDCGKVCEPDKVMQLVKNTGMVGELVGS
jgi:pyruvate ferredoxin oxidoreductase delta subunit